MERAIFAVVALVFLGFFFVTSLRMGAPMIFQAAPVLMGVLVVVGLAKRGAPIAPPVRPIEPPVEPVRCAYCGGHRPRPDPCPGCGARA